MKLIRVAWAILSVVAAGSTLAQSAAGSSTRSTADPARPTAEQAHRADDVARHRLMAQAHEEAARCLESGTPEKTCQQRLREVCKGIALGQYCGMRHAH